MRAALIGCGEMSRAWLAAAAKLDDIEIVGLADLDEGRARSRAAEFGHGDVVIANDIETLLARSRPDMLFDVVVPAARHGVVLAALAAGCHVLSEKPLADTLVHARELVHATRSASRLHAVIQNRRYLPGIRRLRRLIESGALGKVTGLHCDFFKAPHFGGFREQMEHVLLLDMAIHSFDAARYLAGVTPESVYCHETNPDGSWFAAGAAANAIFTLPTGGVLTYRGSWCANGMPTSWNGQWRVVGDRGTAIWDGEDTVTAEGLADPAAQDGLFSVTQPIAVPPLHPDDGIDGHLGLLRDFAPAVREGREPETVSHSNLCSLAMVFGAIESAKTGRSVSLAIPDEPEVP